MQNKALTVLLIEDNPQYAELVQHWLSGATDEPFELNWTDTLAAGKSRLENGGVDVILLDLGLPDCAGIETYAQTRAIAPSTPTLVLSSGESQSMAVQMIQRGAEDYLVKSTCSADSLIRAMRYAVIRNKSLIGSEPLSAVRNRVIGVIGAKGGVGTTTVACTLASELRFQTGQEVLLADLDPDGGNVSFLTGVDAKHSVQDARETKRLDLAQWDAMVAQTPTGLKVISSGSLPGDTRMPTESFGDVLKLVRPQYPWTVLDLGRMNQDSLALLGSVSEVFLITTPAIPALYNAKRATEALQAADIEPERIRIIVNHAGESQPVPRMALHNMFGIPVFATIPNDTDELFVACVEKRLPGTNSHVRRAVATMARKLTGFTEQPHRGTFSSLLSLGERFRKQFEAVTASRT